MAGVDRINRCKPRRSKSTDSDRVILDLTEPPCDPKESEKAAFFDLSKRLANSSDGSEQRRLKVELARMTFSELGRSRKLSQPQKTQRLSAISVSLS
jgi:hypothetical protein